MIVRERYAVLDERGEVLFLCNSIPDAVAVRDGELRRKPEAKLSIEPAFVLPASYSEAMRLVPADVRKRLAADYPALADVYGFAPSRRVH